MRFSLIPPKPQRFRKSCGLCSNSPEFCDAISTRPEGRFQNVFISQLQPMNFCLAPCFCSVCFIFIFRILDWVHITSLISSLLVHFRPSFLLGFYFLVHGPGIPHRFTRQGVVGSYGPLKELTILECFYTCPFCLVSAGVAKYWTGTGNEICIRFGKAFVPYFKKASTMHFVSTCFSLHSGGPAGYGTETMRAILMGRSGFEGGKYMSN